MGTTETRRKATTRQVEEGAGQKSRGRRLWLAALAGVPVVLIDLAHPRLTYIHSVQGQMAFAVAQVVLAAVVVFGAGGVLFAGRLTRGSPAHGITDLLFAVGAAVVLAWSVVALILHWPAYAANAAIIPVCPAVVITIAGLLRLHG